MTQGNLCPRLCTIISNLDRRIDIARTLASVLETLSWNVVMTAGPHPLHALLRIAFSQDEINGSFAAGNPCGSLLGCDHKGFGLRSMFGFSGKSHV